MFNFFKRKNKIPKEDIDFLATVAKYLPSKYSYLNKQINAEFILEKKNNELGDKGCYRFVLNANLESEFADKTLPNFFILKDIKIWNNVSNTFTYVELHIMEGMLVGFRITEPYSALDLSKIDVSNIKEKKFNNRDVEMVQNILGIKDLNEFPQLDISGTFKIEIPEGTFYTVKDFKDGNYLSIDNSGKLYWMQYDPYMIDPVFNTKEDFINALKFQEFNTLEYYKLRFPL